ncbi:MULTISPECIES: transposase [Bacillus]|uniref:transposase n=1 Tax=Bacillus TaxID=1386 RepID=UPI001D0CFA27|nr:MULTISPECIES: transposase [Bacillus]
MARRKREWKPDHFYHVGCRGNRKEAIFRNRADFHAFFYILDYIYDKAPFEITSYCLMTNHYHLLVRTKELNLSALMGLLNKRYATYFNSKYNLTGHVFENRFFSEAITDRKGLMDVSHYIHYNPVKANIVKDPKEYKWSSYQYFNPQQTSNSIPQPYINIEPLLNLFQGKDDNERSFHYREYCKNLQRIINDRDKRSTITLRKTSTKSPLISTSNFS